MEEEKNQNQNKISEFDKSNEGKSSSKAENVEADELVNVESTIDLVMKQYEEVIEDLVDIQFL